jgi:hypothetical protein
MITAHMVKRGDAHPATHIDQRIQELRKLVVTWHYCHEGLLGLDDSAELSDPGVGGAPGVGL